MITHHFNYETTMIHENHLNVENKCWFFFDSEYLRYLQNGKLTKTVNLDMNWLIEYMKEEKLKVSRQLDKLNLPV